MSGQAISSLSYPFPEVPAPGKTVDVAPGIHWLSMPLPFKLDHINLWLIEEEEGGNASWTVVDTGIGNAETRALWEKILGTRHVKRVLLTYCHPDHAGNAAWLCERYGAELWTTQGEYLTAHAVRTASAGYTPDAVLAVFRKNGLDEERAARMRGPRNRDADLVPDFPHSYRRIIEGDQMTLGKYRWRAIVGHGHAPEHLSLYCQELNTVIAGDMLLSTISTNVSYGRSTPRAIRCASSLIPWPATGICPKTCSRFPRTASPFAARIGESRNFKNIMNLDSKSLSNHWRNPKARLTCSGCSSAGRLTRIKHFLRWARR
jgi:glyoxylase-like metal-dependent hydrolase (beta-lactamase superfamily II)